MRYILSLFIVLVTFHSVAQEINGRVFYTSMFKIADDTNVVSERDNDPEYQALTEQLKKPFVDEYQLMFTQNESVFKTQPKLDKPDPKSGGMSISIKIMGDSDVYYKNLSKNILLKETEFFGKPFLVSDSLDSREWELHNESKTVGEYVCFKATHTPKVEDEEDDSKKAKEVTTVWYTPQIPVQNGPLDYQGVPGLIMEVQKGELTIVCTKIVLNPVEEFTITRPKKGKKVTSEEFETIAKEKMDEMMQNYKLEQRSRD